MWDVLGLGWGDVGREGGGLCTFFCFLSLEMAGREGDETGLGGEGGGGRLSWIGIGIGEAERVNR